MANKKKLYIVKREVFATSLLAAARERGRIYEISVADEKYQPDSLAKIKGFKAPK